MTDTPPPVAIRFSTPTTEAATGLLAPLLRVTAHFGYILGALDEMGSEHFADNTDTVLSDAIRELQAAQDHFEMVSAVRQGAYITEHTIHQLTLLSAQMSVLKGAPHRDRDLLMRSLQNLIHNAAYIAALLDHDTTGLTTSEGRMP